MLIVSSGYSATVKYRRGFDMPVDCIAGQQAHEALRKFQTESGLHPTGELDAPAKERLGIR